MFLEHVLFATDNHVIIVKTTTIITIITNIIALLSLFIHVTTILIKMSLWWASFAPGTQPVLMSVEILWCERLYPHFTQQEIGNRELKYELCHGDRARMYRDRIPS